MMLMLPYPISTNRYWRTFRGRTVRSSEALEYKDAVQEIAHEAGLTMRTGCVRVEMILHPALPKDWMKRERRDPSWVLGVRRIDLDNAQKVCLDALQGIAYENDRQVTNLSIVLGHAVPNGSLAVNIKTDLVWEKVA
jgi:crossover junction endodeoxyribonuclease RusA